MLAPEKQLEIREPVRVACDQLTVDDAGADRKRIDGRDDRWKPIAPIEPAPRDEADALAVMMGEHAVAIVLDLMHPVGAGRRLVGAGRNAGRDVAVGARLSCRSNTGSWAIGNDHN